MLGSFLFFSFCSDPAACPDLESDMCSWGSFLSSVREEIEKAEVRVVKCFIILSKSV